MSSGGGSVRSSGPLDTTFMQHTDERRSGRGDDCEEDDDDQHPPRMLDVSNALDFTDCGCGDGGPFESGGGAGLTSPLQQSSPVVMRRFDGKAGWVELAKRWLSPLSEREIAQLRVLDNQHRGDIERCSAVESVPRGGGGGGTYFSVGRSRSVAASPSSSFNNFPTTALPSRSHHHPTAPSTRPPPTGPTPPPSFGTSDAADCSLLGGRFRRAGRHRGKTARNRRDGETADGADNEDGDEDGRGRLSNMMPLEEDCGSPHRPGGRRRRRCEGGSEPLCLHQHASPIPVYVATPLLAAAAVAEDDVVGLLPYIPTSAIGTPQINRMMSTVALRSSSSAAAVGGTQPARKRAGGGDAHHHRATNLSANHPSALAFGDSNLQDNDPGWVEGSHAPLRNRNRHRRSTSASSPGNRSPNSLSHTRPGVALRHCRATAGLEQDSEGRVYNDHCDDDEQDASAPTTRCASTETIATRHLIFTDGIEEEEEDADDARFDRSHAVRGGRTTLIGDAQRAADRFASALLLRVGEGVVDGRNPISRLLFETDD